MNTLVARLDLTGVSVTYISFAGFIGRAVRHGISCHLEVFSSSLKMGSTFNSTNLSTRITSVKLGFYFTSNLWTSVSCALMTPSVIRNVITKHYVKA